MSGERSEQMTADEKRELEAELAELEGPRRAAMVEAIATARSFGDLSENFEYHAAKNEQGLLERRISILRDRLQHAVLVDEETAAASDAVSVGSKVEIEDDDGERMTVEISSVRGVSPDAPLGRALLGAKVGDHVDVPAPRGVVARPRDLDRPMIPEAKLVEAEGGLVPQGEGWYVLNTREAQWGHTETMGSYCTFEGDVRFEQLGFNVSVLHPGQPGGMYHAEDTQEGFLILTGEAVLVIEGEERRLGPWDFVHCPANTEHIIVGAGDGPCVMVAAGARREGRPIVYPVSEVAARHGASVAEETTVPREAYAAYPAPTTAPAPELP